jgi:hypothetical protein
MTRRSLQPLRRFVLETFLPGGFAAAAQIPSGEAGAAELRRMDAVWGSVVALTLGIGSRSLYVGIPFAVSGRPTRRLLLALPVWVISSPGLRLRLALRGNIVHVVRGSLHVFQDALATKSETPARRPASFAVGELQARDPSRGLNLTIAGWRRPSSVSTNRSHPRSPGVQRAAYHSPSKSTAPKLVAPLVAVGRNPGPGADFAQQRPSRPQV